MKYFKINDRVRLKQKDANNNYIYGKIFILPNSEQLIQMDIVPVFIDCINQPIYILSKYIEKIED